MGSAGAAERERPDTFSRTFYPVPEHTRAIEPDVVLILGERGAGKSALFRSVLEPSLLHAIVRTTRNPRLAALDLSKTTWVAGYPIETEFPDAPGLQRLLRRDPGAAQNLWFAYLVRRVWDRLDSRAQQSLSGIHGPQGGEVEAVCSAYAKAESEPVLAIDRLDKSLRDENAWVFITYDELDLLGGFDWEAMAVAISSLVSFWASYSRRWQRVRAKIFLRTDLFRRYGQVIGADLIKLAANRAELTWSDRDLYAMLVKRIANTSGALADYCRDAKLGFSDDPVLGLIPTITSAEQARPLIERMAGPYMGANVKKGRTFYWLLDHVRDGNDRATPRSLVRLVEKAAVEEINSPRATHNRLLDSSSLRWALDAVSQDHVVEVMTHELPWIAGLRDRVKGSQVPIESRELEKRLRKNWDSTWFPGGSLRPPVGDADDLVDFLVELGVLFERSDERLDVPDLFLAGLELKRKGGVRR
jgi:hypothetical protein